MQEITTQLWQIANCLELSPLTAVIGGRRKLLEDILLTPDINVRHVLRIFLLSGEDLKWFELSLLECMFEIHYFLFFSVD